MMTRNIPTVLLASALLLAVAGCSDRGTEPITGGSTDTTVSFAADLQPIFNQTCLTCHGTFVSGGLDLTPAVAWANLVGVAATGNPSLQRVIPGNPEQSVLYLKIIGDGSVGNRMPEGGVLDVDTIEQFRMWIVQGAENN